jgi:N-acetylglucosamine-6-sulfatase
MCVSRGRLVCVLVISLLALTACTGAPDGDASTSPTPATSPRSSDTSDDASTTAEDPPERPNIVLITADDMSKSDLRWMPATKRLLADRGVTIDDFLSNHPLCCPARAQILTGQYGHNNGVLDNEYSSRGGYKRLRQPDEHIGVWLQRAGYQTALVGKHINGWERAPRRDPGWTVFNPIQKAIYAPYGMTMFMDGEPRRFDDIHTSDLMGDFTVQYIKAFARSDAPFFIWTSQVAPHGMYVDDSWGLPVPARRHEGLYPDVRPPSMQHPGFNEQDVSDKPPWVQEQGPVSPDDVIAWHRARVQSLRSVDDQVRATVAALRDVGELDNTYIVFTSDNGMMLGEHRLMHKNKPYEPSVLVPLLVRGPGLEPGAVHDVTYSLVDLAATFLEIGDAEAGRLQDGRSMLPALRGEGGSYSHYLIQAAGWELPPPPGTPERGWWWRGVRSQDYVYVRYDSGFEELYDMRRDPAQLQNLAGEAEYSDVRREYAARLAALVRCAGADCQTGGDESVAGPASR